MLPRNENVIFILICFYHLPLWWRSSTTRLFAYEPIFIDQTIDSNHAANSNHR